MPDLLHSTVEKLKPYRTKFDAGVEFCIHGSNDKLYEDVVRNSCTCDSACVNDIMDTRSLEASLKQNISH